MKRIPLLAVALVAGAAPFAVLGGGQSHALPLCVQYNDPIHHGSYPVCPLGGRPVTQAGPKIPTSTCDIEKAIGVTYVKECESGTS